MNGAGRVASNGYRLPDPLPQGERLIDNTKKEWIIGSSIGKGGFGEIYLAKPANDKTDNWNYVIKIDHRNGPLYAEMYFYHRVAKEESIRDWMRVKGLEFLGMPRYIASGIHERILKGPKASKSSKSTSTVNANGKSTSNGTANTLKYRFLVMQRFGDDLQKKLDEVNGTFDLKTTYTIAKKVIDILEYIHSFGYIHADIKASNLLLGRSYAPTPKGKGLAETHGIHSECWLVDFGLVEKYRTSDGKHKDCEEDQRRANNGTVEFTSRDAHIGALCRRSDLEILAFNMLSWLSGGRLPWMTNLKDHKFVYNCKKYFMDRLHELFNYAFKKPSSRSKPNTTTPTKGANVGNGQQRSLSPVPFVEYEPLPPNTPVFDKSKLTVEVPEGLTDYFLYITKLGFDEDPDYALLKCILSRAIAKTYGQDLDDGRFFFKKLPAKTVAKIAGKLKRRSLSSPDIRNPKARTAEPEPPVKNGTKKKLNGKASNNGVAVHPVKCELADDDESPIATGRRGRKRVAKVQNEPPEVSPATPPKRAPAESPMSSTPRRDRACKRSAALAAANQIAAASAGRSSNATSSTSTDFASPEDTSGPTKGKRRNVRSRSVVPPKAPSVSAPTSFATPTKESNGVASVKSPFDNPTPAMIEILNKLKEKRAEQRSSVTSVPSTNGANCLHMKKRRRHKRS